jgi:MFS family permease
MAISPPSTPRLAALGWRTPAVIVLCGCLISLLSFGPRATLGFFLTPMSQANGWDREVFGLAVAVQNIIWGVGQPLAGAIADRFGTLRVLCAGGIFYAAGLVLMAHSTSPGLLDLSAGVLVGFGLAGCSFAVVLGAFGKLLPESWRLLAFGAGTAAGSFGQFLYSPLAVSLIDAYGWQNALFVFAAGTLLVLPLSFALVTAPADAGSSKGGASQ